MKAALIEQEETRLALLRGYNILDTAPEEGFDDIARLAADFCGMPIALVSLVDEERQWFKAATGTDHTETPVEMSICAHAIQQGDFLEVEDATADPRTADNPLVTGEDNIRFYAGALLRGADGMALGTLCVMDTKPGKLTERQREALKMLADQVMRLIELREALGATELLRREVDHRVKNSLQSLEALIRIQARNVDTDEARSALEAVQGRVSMVSNLHEALYLSDAGAMVEIAAFVRRVIQSATGQLPQGVVVDCELARLDVESRDASSVGMIVNEAIANAAKYAYTGREDGIFRVTGRRADGFYQLTCADNGNGSGGMRKNGTGLGTRIMQAAAQQLGGELERSQTPQGHVVTLHWPLG